MKKITRKQAAKITDIPDRRIQFYTDQGILSDIKTSVGRGIARTYSQKNLFELFVIKELHLNGINLMTIKNILIRVKSLISDFVQFNNEGDFIRHLKDTKPGGSMAGPLSNAGKSDTGKTKVRFDIEKVEMQYEIISRSFINEEDGPSEELPPKPFESRIFLYVFDQGNNVTIAREDMDDLSLFDMANRKTGLAINLTKEIEIVANA